MSRFFCTRHYISVFVCKRAITLLKLLPLPPNKTTASNQLYFLMALVIELYDIPCFYTQTTQIKVIYAIIVSDELKQDLFP